MANLLITNIGWLVTMNPTRDILRDAWLQIMDGFITDLGIGIPPEAKEMLNAKGGIVTPGFVNTHHHMFQNLARAYTPISNLPLLPWLKGHLPLWRTFTIEDLGLATEMAMAELMLSGCTTTSDHHYVFPDGLDQSVQFETAKRVGMRFSGCRGYMDRPSDIVPEWLTQSIDEILADSERLTATYHSTEPGALTQLSYAPCTVFSCSGDLMKETARLGRKNNIRLHTHSGETVEEDAQALELFGRRPFELLEDYEWKNDLVWLAHGIHFNDREVSEITGSKMGVAHCPTSNMRLGSGCCRVQDLRAGGSAVSLGVDGSASNDSGHMLSEARNALLLNRVTRGAETLTPETALEMATIEGARNLGRENEIGSLEIGKCGDLAIFPAEDLWSNGAENPLHALLLCHPRNVDTLIVQGRITVQDGQLTTIDLPILRERHSIAARRLHASV